MNTDAPDRPDLRELGKNAIRAEVAQRAIILLDERGFDATTVEEIAAAAGISPRSFFRYFPSKEDVVLGSIVPMGSLIEEALFARPNDESPWSALRAAMDPLVRLVDADHDGMLRSTRVGLSTAGLRAKNIERHTAWAEAIAPILAERFTLASQHASMAASALAQSALACMYVATLAWVAGGGADSYSDLMDEAFGAVGRL